MTNKPEIASAIANFIWAFPPNPIRHGQMRNYVIETGQKESVTIKEKVSAAMIEDHLARYEQNGRLGYLAGGRSETNVGVLDIDRKTYRDRFDEVVAKIRHVLSTNKIPFYYEVSTNGGAHIWIFTQPVMYNEMREFLRSVLAEAGEMTVEYYPAGSRGVDGKWVYMPYSGSIVDANGLGITYLVDANGDPIPVTELKSNILRVEAAFVRLWAERQRQREELRKKDPKRTKQDLHVTNIEKLKLYAEKPPKSFARHTALMAFLNLGRRAGVLHEMEEHLKSQAVYEAWISDGSRTMKGWAEEVKRWAENLYEAEEYGQEYGIPELKQQGWVIGSFVKTNEHGGMEISDMSPTEIAEQWYQSLINSKKYMLYRADLDRFYIYREGVYVEYGIESVKKELELWCVSAGMYPSEAKLSEILAKFGRLYVMYDDGEMEDESGSIADNDFINFRNGLYNWKTGEFTAHDPDIVQFTICDTNYVPEYRGGDGGVFVRDLLKVSLPDHLDGARYRKVLQKYLGYAATAETRAQVMLNLNGVAGSGKSTIMRVFTDLFSSRKYKSASAVIGFSYEELGNGHALDGLIGKRCITIGEIRAHSQRARDAMVNLKQIVGEDSLTVNPKNKKPFSHKFICKFIISSNVNIHLGEDAANDSVTRRLIIIPFQVKPQKDETLEERILDNDAEKSKALMWILDGLEDLRKDGWKFRDRLEDTQEGLKRESNSCIEFFEEMIEVVDMESGVQANALREAYNQWAIENGVQQLSSQMFKKKFAAAVQHAGWTFADRTSPGTKGLTGDVCWDKDINSKVIRGIRLKPTRLQEMLDL